MAIITRFGFAPFAWYRIVVGAVALVWLANRSKFICRSSAAKVLAR